ncbi:MAG TPA: sugar ABC transporter substrate-binding protein, partial [Limnochordia bacterium]
MLRRGLSGRLRRWTLGLIAAACAGWVSSITAAPVTITYSSWGSNEEIQRFRDLAAVFNERHTDIQVEILHITGDYNAALLTQLAAGVGPDSFHLFDSQPPQMARNGMLENLLPYLEKDPTLRLEDFYPPLLTLARYEGGLYGLPPDENPIVLYVNEEMFARSGLTSPIALDRSGDWTWQAFREAADKLAGPASGGGRTETYGFFLPNWWAPVLPFVWAGGGALFSEDASRSLLTDPATLAGLEFLAAMIHEDRSSSHVMPADPNGLFREGRLAMIPQGRWMVPTYRTLLSGIDWDVVAMPEGPAGRFTAIAGAFSGMNAH